MLTSIRGRVERICHDFRCRNVFDTPPLKIVPSNLNIVTMLCHADVTMYLVAIKSFYKQIGHGQIVIVDDGSLSSADRALLVEHVGACFVPIGSVDTGSLPRGGCWERLATILDLASSSYVIQVDSDTLTRANVPEILDCIRANRSFTLGTTQGQKFVPLATVSEVARASEGTHVQHDAECNLVNLPNSQSKRYVRGCAGFAGFAKGACTRDQAIEFSAAMSKFIGDKWKNWGSEQVASNFLISNDASSIVLPYPKYACFELDVDLSTASFLHFIGTNRFDKGVYSEQSISFIRSIRGERGHGN